MTPKTVSSRIRHVLLLDPQGIVVALAIGGLLVYISPVYFVILLIFLLLSVMVTKYGYYEKKSMGIYEHERSWENVVSNGLVPLIAAFVSPYAYLGAVAAVTSDKFASELGVLGEEPIDLLTLKKTKPGTSGAVSPFGTFMSFVGALAIGLTGTAFLNISLYDAVVIGVIGWIGSLVDSVVGVLEERGIGNKMTTNIVCALIGMLLGYMYT